MPVDLDDAADDEEDDAADEEDDAAKALPMLRAVSARVVNCIFDIFESPNLEMTGVSERKMGD